MGRCGRDRPSVVSAVASKDSKQVYKRTGGGGERFCMTVESVGGKKINKSPA